MSRAFGALVSAGVVWWVLATTNETAAASGSLRNTTKMGTGASALEDLPDQVDKETA